MTRYLLDTNIFIEAKNRYYGFDFCPAFWDWIVEQNAAGKVASIDKVEGELLGYADELSEWASSLGAAFFLPPDDAVAAALVNVSTWATSQQYRPAALATFFQIADYWLVGHALAHGFTVVTREQPSNQITQIKIPNACIGLTIPCISPYEMLRRERARFVLGRPTGAA